MKYSFKKTFLTSFGIALILLLILFEPLRKLRKQGNLYYGGHSNFYSDTLVSLTKYMFYTPEIHSLTYYALHIFLMLLILSILFSFCFNRKLFSLKNITLSITTLCILSIITQHYLLGTLYLIDRTALFFYPLFLFCLCFSLQDFPRKGSAKVLALVVLAFGLNFMNYANFYKTATWFFDARSMELLDLLNEKGKQQQTKIKIDFSWPFHSSLEYYMEQNSYPFIVNVKNKQDREELNRQTDYYIYLAHSLEKVGYIASHQKIRFVAKDTLMSFPSENILVFEWIKKVQKPTP